MTVSTIGSIAEFDTNGVTTNYPFYFKFLANEDLVVTYVNPAGVSSVLTLGTNYTVNGAGNDLGGSIVTTTALAGPGQLVVSREMDAYQQTSLRNQGKFLAETHEDVFDRLTMLIQQGFSIFARALKRPFGRDYFFAENRRIASIHDPVENQDAVTKLYNERYIAGILSDFTGPLNNAANVMYIYPDGVARTVQSLATKNNPLLGAAGIAYKNTDVYIELNSLDSRVSVVEGNSDINTAVVSRVFGSTLDAITIPMHFGALRGRGWTAGDPPQTPEDLGNIKSTTATAAVSSTGTDIPVASTTYFTAGMLICYLGTDGDYYSVKLHAILPGPIFRLGETLPQPIASGAPIYNFYRDDAHPNYKGAAAVVDDALRRMKEYRVRELEYRSISGAIWEPVSGSVLTSLTSTSYGNPGGLNDGERGISVVGSAVDSGAQSRWVSLTGGDYIVAIPLNIGLRDGGFSAFVTAYVDEVTPEGDTQTIASSGGMSGYDCIRMLEISFSCRPGSLIRVRVLNGNSGGWTFYLGALNFYRLAARISPINRGTVCLFGDSWFSAGSGMAVRFTEKLNKANVSVQGIGGNVASQMIDRFHTDVAPLNPNYVIVCVGTNNAYGGTAPGLFEQQVLQLRRMIQGIGAQAVFFDCSVCAITFTPEKLSPSRTLALRTRYENISSDSGSAGVAQRSATFQGTISINAGATALIGVVPGRTRGPAVLRAAYLNQTSQNVIVDYPSIVDGASAVDASTFTGAVNLDKTIPRSTDSVPRFVAVRINNPTGGVVAMTYAFDVCWTQER